MLKYLMAAYGKYQIKKRTIRDMTDKAFSIINKHYTGGNEYMNIFKDKYDNDNKPLNKRITRDTEMMILNYQKEFNL